MTFVGLLDALHHYEGQLTQLQTVVGQEVMTKQVMALQTFFRQDLWPLISQLELPQQSQWNSAVTEMHRHMRLLTLETSFAQSARQENTRQQRLETITQRVEQLQGFNQVLLALLSSEQ
ncbi:MAG: heterocyst frequency control protein PatD [Leptolyngbyaceae cyanobacterium]